MGSQQPIPVSEICDYGRMAGFHEEELPMLFRVIKALERVWVRDRARRDKQKNDSKKGGGPGGATPRPRPRSRPPRRR